MKVSARKIRRSQQGVALLLSIFTLMLLSVVATALVLTAGTATAIKANYKSSMQAFYGAKAGLEEGRSRLWTGNPDTLTNCLFPVAGSPMPMNQVCYIVNPDQTTGEVVNPTDMGSYNPYADREYATEQLPGPANIPAPLISDSPIASAGIGGPSYKWVRVTPTTEASSGIHVSGNRNLDANSPIYYDGAREAVWFGVGAPPVGSQVLTVTALAVTPTGGFSGRRLLQYTVAQNPNPLGQMLENGGPPPPLNQIFPAALTLDGNGVTYSGSVAINGQDSSSPSPSTAGVQGIAYTNSSDPKPSCNCQSPTGVPSVGTVTLPNEMQTPAGLDALVNSITADSSVVINGPADETSLPSGMSPGNPMIVVVNGDFHLTHAGGASAFTGYGLLLVTGTLYYDADDSWYGLILVIGKGVFNGTQVGHNGQINGAVLVANTRDSSGALLSQLGPASYNQSGGGKGIQYSSNWIGKTQSMVPYQILSFREIEQQQP